MRELVGQTVIFQGERYLVTKVLPSGRDIVIRNEQGQQLTVSPMTVEVE